MLWRIQEPRLSWEGALYDNDSKILIVDYCRWEVDIRWVGVSGFTLDMRSLLLKRDRISWTDYKQAQLADLTLMRHCYSDVDIVAGLCWRRFSSLSFLDSNYIHKFRVYSCIYHFKRFIFVEFTFLWDVCGVTPYFPRKFSSTLVLLAVLTFIISQFLLISIIIAYYKGNNAL